MRMEVKIIRMRGRYSLSWTDSEPESAIQGRLLCTYTGMHSVVPIKYPATQRSPLVRVSVVSPSSVLSHVKVTGELVSELPEILTRCKRVLHFTRF